ncbi:MAG: matrixin family metalloprotease, partial [Candidatus Gastranaerophilales bacterium]|nr:matrixin family metalloprotease [Candidatus Gastranaerophilales bacterium]
MKKIIFSLFIAGLLLAQNSFGANYFDMGKAAFNKKDYKTANTYFVKALIADPNNATCRYYYAQTLTYLNNYAQAKKEYKYVTLLAPNTKLAEYSFQSIAYLDKKTASNTSNSTANPNANSQSLSNDNYIKKALTTKGTLVTWDSDRMPLKVYLDNSKKVSVVYVNAVKAALNTWQSASSGLFSYLIVNDPKIADINIAFKGMAQKSENQNLGITHYMYKDEYISHINMEMYTLGPSYKPLKDYDVYTVALHELGHALGIVGHSDNKDDVMHATYDPSVHNARTTLTLRDKNTIQALYSIDKNPYSTSLTSINKVLGDKNTR